MLEDKRWGTKGGGDMMDDREEHWGRSAHSSVGGIYRSNRTVSTCLCHLLECVRRCSCGFALTRVVIFPCCLQRCLPTVGYAWNVLSASAHYLARMWNASLFVSLLWYMTYPPSPGCSICSCLLFLSDSGVFHETWCCSRSPHRFLLQLITFLLLFCTISSTLYRREAWVMHRERRFWVRITL